LNEAFACMSKAAGQGYMTDQRSNDRPFTIEAGEISVFAPGK
jgi:hypothetical protein